MKDIMIDFETLGTGKRCVILSVGLLLFDPIKGDIGEGIHVVCNIDEQKKLGRETDKSTIDWWERQSAEAKGAVEEAFSGGGVSYNAVLDIIEEFIRNVRNATLWSNGANFDIAVLEEMYKLAGRKLPWTFWKTRCVRTVHDVCKEVYGVAYKKEVEQPAIAHNALEDCKYQARYVSKCLQHFNR